MSDQHFPIKNPLISFLTVNYKQAAVSKDLIASLQELFYQNWQLVLVDNGPCDTDLKEAVEKTGKGIYLATNANLGFAGANNRGLELCEGEYIFFINNDTEVSPDFLDNIPGFVQKTDNLGMLSPKIKYHQQKDLIQYAGFTPLSKISVRNKGIGYQQKDAGQYDEVRKTAFIHGAAMLVPRHIIEKIGLMYEDYFLYYEEYDWCARIKKAGFDIWYYGLAEIYHKESVSTGVDSSLKIYYLTRNRLLFARRNFTGASSFLTLLYFTFIAMPKNVLQWWLRGRTDLAKAFFKAYIWNLTHKSSPFENRN